MCYFIPAANPGEVIHGAILQVKKLRHRELSKLSRVTELRAELGCERRLLQSRAPTLKYDSPSLSPGDENDDPQE